jgi:dihydrofolate reductase
LRESHGREGRSEQRFYFTACTLDGFIADEKNSLDWLFEVPREEEDRFWDGWFPSVGGLVMGATTYEWMVEHDRMLDNPEQFRSYYGDRPAWVFTHRDLRPIPGVEIAFVRGSVTPVYEEIAARLGAANIWLVGGGDLVGQFHEANLLDEIILGMTPVTLGRGAPLLPRRITSKQLAFREAELIGQRLRVVIDVKNRSQSSGTG